jgi:cystathionine gamma-lyase
MTHANIPPAKRKALGIEGVVSLSCRIEEVEYLVEDARGGLDGLDDEDSGYESGLVTSPNVSSASAETEVVCPR